METLTYDDPLTGCRGYLVYDDRQCRLAAGGCRVQVGLTLQTLAELAARMTLKQRVLGLNVDGAKCGLDYDPSATDAPAVVQRFLGFLRSELTTRFSMGCDMGTRFDQLQRMARAVGLPSIKYAVRAAQELTDDDFAQRMHVLDAVIGGQSITERRAGHALAHASLAAVTGGGYRAPGLRVGLQGFGNLGRSAALSLVESGARVVAIADEFGCIASGDGFDVVRLLEAERSQPVSTMAEAAQRRAGPELFGLDVDVLVLAGGVNDLTDEQLAAVQAPVVVVGANCGLSGGSERGLEDRGVVVIPDFVGGAGGSASMEALFGPDHPPTPEELLFHIAALTTELTTDVITAARNRGVTSSQVARDIAAAALVSTGERPYGRSPYAIRGDGPRGSRGRTGMATNRATTQGGIA